MLPTSDYIANDPYYDRYTREFLIVGNCESAFCDLPAIGYCHRCGNLLCGMCSHPTTPKIDGYWLCTPQCLYELSQLRDYGYQ